MNKILMDNDEILSMILIEIYPTKDMDLVNRLVQQLLENYLMEIIIIEDNQEIPVMLLILLFILIDPMELMKIFVSNKRLIYQNKQELMSEIRSMTRISRIKRNIFENKSFYIYLFFSRMNESNNQYGPDYSHNAQKNGLVSLQSRPSKGHFQTNEISTNRNSMIQSQTNPNHYPWHKSQSKPTRIQPILSTNTNNLNSQRERETSRLSNTSKTDSIQQTKQNILNKNSINNYQIKSPTSWSIISEHQNDQQNTEISTSPSSHDELINENSSTPSRTYRLTTNDQQQPLDGRYVIPYNKYIIRFFF